MSLQNNIFLAGTPSFLEAPVKLRFQQEDWTVYGPCANAAEERACLEVNNIRNIIFFSDSDIEEGDFSALQATLNAAVRYRAERFFFLSSMHVFSETQIHVNEASAPCPDNDRGKNYLLAEQMVASYCHMYDMKYCVIRTNDIYGPGQVPAEGNISQQLLSADVTGKASAMDGADEFLFVDDFVFALYQTIERVHAQSLLHLTSGASVNSSALGQAELGWTYRYDWTKGSAKTAEWLQKYRRETAENDNKIQRDWRKVKSAVIPYAENILGFILMWGIMKLQDGNPVNGLIYLDMNYVYIGTMGLLYGKRQALLAFMLSSFLLGINLLEHGSEIVSILYVPKHLLHFTSYLFAAILTGYFADQKKYEMASVNWEKEQMQEEYDFLRDVLKKTVEIKDNLYRQIINSEDSIGRIYRIIKRLDRVEPENIFTQAAAVTADILDVRDVALYVPTKNKQFVRLKVCLGQTAETLLKSKRVEDFSYLQDVITNKKIFTNKDLLSDAPDMAAPILYQDDVEAVLEIRDLKIEQWNLSEQNLLSITCRLISAAIARAYRYEAEVMREKYVEDTRILKAEEFERIIAAMKDRRAVQGAMTIVLLRIERKHMSLLELNERLNRVIRVEDFVGMKNDEVYLLLTELDKNAVQMVQGRLRQVEIMTEMEEVL